MPEGLPGTWSCADCNVSNSVLALGRKGVHLGEKPLILRLHRPPKERSGLLAPEGVHVCYAHAAGNGLR